MSMDSKAIDNTIENARDAFCIPGVSVAVVCGDETYVHGYGSKEMGKNDPVDAETLFAVGSVTKAFTTAAMAMLIDEGKMAWDDHPRKHVPGFSLHDPLADANVTLRDLVAHRTGLARHDCLWYNSAWSSEELLDKLPHLPLAYSFRSTYQYNNLMYMVAGLAVESAAGMPWADFVKSRILDPLGMSRSVLSVNDLAAAGNFCTPHEMKEEEVVTVPWSNVDSVNACGSINSCARDLAHWLRFQLGDGQWQSRMLLAKERLSEMHSSQIVVPVDDPSRQLGETTMSSYCLGWNLLNYRDWTIVAHGGAIDGFNASVVLIPKAGVGVAVLSNLCQETGCWPIRNIVMDYLLGLPEKGWIGEVKAINAKNREKAKATETERAAKRVSDTQPSLDLTAYAGDYADDGYGTALVALDDGALTFSWNNHNAKLEHWHFDTFAGKYVLPDWPIPIEVLFGLDSDGSVGSLRLIWPDSGMDHTFKKVK